MSDKQARDILVTSALPYANGPIHLGHMLEYIQTDVWVRFQKMRGHTCYYVCADDTHGTAVMLRAERENTSAEALIERVNKEHSTDFNDFLIGFDNYYSTHSPENQELASAIYTACRDAGDIAVRKVKQFFDPEKQMFLADRYVTGTCPKCKAPDQNGDNCEVCSATYAPHDLIDPKSAISGATPVEKESEHYFFTLSNFTDFLKDWTRSGTLQNSVANKLSEWLDSGLQDWDISRDAPYFGFEIPDAPGKYFYVWLDAPVGYMASFKNLCDREGIDFDRYWSRDSKAELYHFIGKDIINFHALFWPAMLKTAGYRTPNGVYAHGYLTINGEKMSKSRGTFITARNYLDHVSPEYLRYYFAAKLGQGVEDIDLNLEDFMQRVNTDLVNKVVNIASRCAGFVKKAGGQLSTELESAELYQIFVDEGEAIAQAYEQREYSKAVRLIMALADRANEYIQEKAPWVAAKEAGREQEVLNSCSMGINLFRVIMTYLAPLLPETAIKTQAFLNVTSLNWADIKQPLSGHSINKFKPLLTRVEAKQIEAVQEAARTTVAAETALIKGKSTKSAEKPSKPVDKQTSSTIDFPAFAAVDLRVAKVLSAAAVEGADKLLQLQLDVGELSQKQVFAGIKAHYEAEELVGQHVVLVANLAPRKMRFGLSEGMILAAGDDSRLSVLTVDTAIPAGSKVS